MKIDPNKNPLYVILFATVVAGVFAGGIMALQAVTQPIVERNRRLLREKAIVQMFSLGDVETLSDSQITDLYARRIRTTTINPGTDEAMEILIAYRGDAPPQDRADPRDKTNVEGYAFPIGGIGFWSMIRGYLAVTPDLTHTLGVTFLQHSETPGLGGRITESEFRDQFDPARRPSGQGLDITPPGEGKPYIEISRQPTVPQRHVDAITGATGTSTAVDEFLNEDIRRFRRAAAKAGLVAQE